MHPMAKEKQWGEDEDMDKRRKYPEEEDTEVTSEKEAAVATDKEVGSE